MPVTINAHQLVRLLDRTAGHISDADIPMLHGARLEADDVHLYAITSDRYTVAAARYRHHGLDGEPFARTIPADALTALREWASAVPGHDPVTVAAADGRLRLTAPRSDLGIAVNADAKFFDWRGVLRGAIEQSSDVGAAFPVLDTRLLGRFGTADDMVRIRVTADQEAVLIVGEDFLGAQMPARASARRDGSSADIDVPAALDDVRTAWQHTLSTSTAAAPQAALPAPPRSCHEAPSTVGDATEELLRQTLRSTRHMIDADRADELFAAHATAGVMAWAAYRYLKALRTADPHLAAAVVADTAEQLDDGAIGEWAWEAAVDAGHDPQEWQNAPEAQAAKAAEKADGQPSVSTFPAQG